MRDTVKPSVLRFGQFTLDPAIPALHRGGKRIRIPRQPLLVLSYLASRPGVLVTRDELRAHIWGDTIVEWDQGLNFCIRRVRATLRDSAGAPIYIETVRGRGYRFVAPVTVDVPPAAIESRWYALRHARLPVGVAALLAAILAGIVIREVARRSAPSEDAQLAHEIEAVSVGDAQDYTLRASEYLRRGGYADLRVAAAMYDSAVFLDPQLALAHAYRARTSTELSWEHGAIEELANAAAAASRALDLAPDLPQALIAQGYFHYSRRQYNSAAVYFLRARERDPADSEILVMLGWVARRAGDWDNALQYLHDALELEPRSHIIAASLGTTYLQLREYASAERYLNWAVSIEPVSSARVSQALLYLLWHGDTARAAAVLREVDRAGLPKEVVVLQHQPLARAVATTLPAWASQSTAPNGLRPHAVLAIRAEMLEALGDTSGARSSFLDARNLLEPLTATQVGDVMWRYQGSDHSLLGTVSAALGDTVAAIRHARLGSRYLPITQDHFQGPQRLRQRAEALLRLGRYDEALNIIERLLAIPSLVSPALLSVDPLWKPVRAHPRFVALAAARTGP